MPLMDGFQATRFIRELERVTDQQIAIIGVSSAASAEECFTAGMDDFLNKPTNKLILKAVLGRWIREKNGRGLASVSRDNFERSHAGLSQASETL